MKFLFKGRSFFKIRNVGCRYFGTRSSNDVQFEPVKLSYATYEGTLPVEDAHKNPLVIMHGLFGSKSNWNSLCKVFQQKTKPSRKIIALDARNHGDSPHDPHHSYELLALDLKDFFDTVGIEKACVMGHSMGGRTAMLFALKYPELVEKLIVVDISPISTSPDISTMPIYMRALTSLNIPNNIPLSRARLAADLQLAENGITDKSLRAFLLTNLVQKQNGSFDWRVNLEALLMNLDNIKRFPYQKGTGFDGPSLFIGGSSSDYIKRDDIPGIKKIFPNSTVEYIEGAGHWLHSEKPAEFLQISLDFLNRPYTS